MSAFREGFSEGFVRGLFQAPLVILRATMSCVGGSIFLSLAFDWSWAKSLACSIAVWMIVHGATRPEDL